MCFAGNHLIAGCVLWAKRESSQCAYARHESDSKTLLRSFRQAVGRGERQSRGARWSRTLPLHCFTVSYYDAIVTTESDLTLDQYRDLAEFRKQIRQFLYFSEVTAKAHGLEPQQHQLLLTVHGLPEDAKPTIREIASRLFIQHNTAVELVNRLEIKGAIARSHGVQDKREVWIRLTPRGQAILRTLALAHRTELERSGPELARALNATLRHVSSTVAR